jgi:hypothetical protein
MVNSNVIYFQGTKLVCIVTTINDNKGGKALHQQQNTFVTT